MTSPGAYRILWSPLLDLSNISFDYFYLFGALGKNSLDGISAQSPLTALVMKLRRFA